MRHFIRFNDQCPMRQGCLAGTSPRNPFKMASPAVARHPLRDEGVLDQAPCRMSSFSSNILHSTGVIGYERSSARSRRATETSSERLRPGLPYVPYRGRQAILIKLRDGGQTSEGCKTASIGDDLWEVASGGTALGLGERVGMFWSGFRTPANSWSWGWPRVGSAPSRRRRGRLANARTKDE